MFYETIDRKIWIDVETGVRDTEDKFSVKYCYEVCKQLKKWIEKGNK